MRIWDASLHLTELVKLVSSRDTPFQQLDSSGTHLLSGTWAAALDIPKGKCPPGTDTFLAVVPQWKDMSWREQCDLMDKVNGYMCGLTKFNPLK